MKAMALRRRMRVNLWMIPPPDLAVLDSAAKDALIRTLIERPNDLTVRLEVLEAENAALRKENLELCVKLDLLPKTPDNSSTRPSQGHKASGAADAKAKAKPHAGACRPLHPNPTRRRDVLANQCQHCRTDVSGVVQTPVHSYDRIEIPEIKPDVTRVALLGGMCPCCAKPFKAAPPAGLEPGSPFGPNLRAFAIYLRFTQAISFERLSRLFSDLGSNFTWKAQMRLCGRFRILTRKGKRPTIVVTAIARELSAFIWAISREVVGPHATANQ
jgi:transposase